MKTQQLFIPDRINVGFQKREDTYTKKLAYVIYFDQKGILRKEKSWNSWRDNKIKPIEFSNEPTEGFVLNKGVGGQRQSYSYNARNEYIRVYDPRDFEFEISVANLLFILREGDCSKGKGLEGKFVYAWDGTELVLLPVVSQDYQNSKNFTNLQNKGVKARELIGGASYITKKQEVITYLGKFDYYYLVDTYRNNEKPETGIAKKYVFWDGKNFVYQNEIKNIAALNSDVITSNYAELVDKYNKSAHGSKVVKLFLKEIKGICEREGGRSKENWFYESPEGFVECRTIFKYDKGWTDEIDYFETNGIINLKDGIINKAFHKEAFRNGKPRIPSSCWYNPRFDEIIPWREPRDNALFVELESGVKIKFDWSIFYKG